MVKPMSYQDIYREKNEEVAERCELVMNRIAEIEKETDELFTAIEEAENFLSSAKQEG